MGRGRALLPVLGVLAVVGIAWLARGVERPGDAALGENLRSPASASPDARAIERVEEPTSLAGSADGTTVGYIIQLFGLITILSVAPGIMIMVTSFTRFIIAK